ncbi:MAG: hypothetical protein QGF00_01710 [Planctomycetota bacterium]|nr:hypothetical protein [Planctomycetota bacterium]MDP7248291.1 hypothetical protein [Planctomycetota bacterium]
MSRLFSALMIGVLAFLQVSVAQEEVAKKEATEAAAEKKAEKPVDLRYVSQRPIDVLARFFKMEGEQTKELNALRTELNNDRRKAMAALEKSLDETYTEKVLAMLTDEQQANFKQVQESLKAYDLVKKKIEDEFKDLYAELGGNNLTSARAQPDQLIWRLPGMTMEERKGIQKVYTEMNAKQNKEIASRMKEANVERPTRSDIKGWRKFNERRSSIYADVAAKHKDERKQKLLASLSKESAEKYQKLADALEAVNKKRTETMQTLVQALGELVGPEQVKKAAGNYGRYYGGQARGGTYQRR